MWGGDFKTFLDGGIRDARLFIYVAIDPEKSVCRSFTSFYFPFPSLSPTYLSSYISSSSSFLLLLISLLIFPVPFYFIIIIIIFMSNCIFPSFSFSLLFTFSVSPFLPHFLFLFLLHLTITILIFASSLLSLSFTILFIFSSSSSSLSPLSSSSYFSSSFSLSLFCFSFPTPYFQMSRSCTPGQLTNVYKSYR